MTRTAAQRVQRAAFVERIVTRVPVLDFNEAVARTYAELYAHFLRPRSRAKGNVHDLQVAATAVAHGFAVLTSNVGDFLRVPGLTVESLLR